MADSITSSKNLSIGIEYTKGSTTTKTSITIPNYKSSLTEQQIKNAFANQNVIYYDEDQSGSYITVGSENIYTASTTNQTINNIDIGWE